MPAMTRGENGPQQQFGFLDDLDSHPHYADKNPPSTGINAP
jgi:hypothetical protein